jgi:hypothetical protein
LLHGGHAQRLLERADHDEKRDMLSAVFLLLRRGQQLHFNVVVDHGGGKQFFFVGIEHKKAKVLRNQPDDLIHVQIDFR